jgi:malonyl-CoA O-methyltransferase
LPPLIEAARVASEPCWEEAARRSLRRQLSTQDATRWNAATHWWGYVVEALVELDERRAARAALLVPSAYQTSGGGVPALPGGGWVSSAGLALLASSWCKLGAAEDCRRASGALAALARRQRTDGGFPGGWGRGARFEPDVELPITAALYLEALAWQARRHWLGHCPDASVEHRPSQQHASDFPAEIDPADGRLAAVLDWCRTLGPAPRIIDVGCGKGRFLRQIQRNLPQATLVGVDVSPAALDRLPAGVNGRQGGLLRIPAALGEFDAAICIEALEHSLLPRRAVAELCRVVRPGGGILIIDKHRAYRERSDHQPWEEWFEPDEVSAWLAPYGDGASSRPIAHGPHSTPTGLFICWTATRKLTSRQQEAA